MNEDVVDVILGQSGYFEKGMAASPIQTEDPRLNPWQKIVSTTSLNLNIPTEQAEILILAVVAVIVFKVL